MPTITFDRFDGGLDLRQLTTNADMNRLRVLKNAYITTGRSIRKRAGLKRIAELTPSSKGLVAGMNQLWTFSTIPLSHGNTLIGNKTIDDPTGTGIDTIEHVEIFNNFFYLCAKYDNGVTKHHYLDGAASTLVTDANCPHTPTIAKKASKIFSIQDNVVRFSATNNARDWSATQDAGFLPVNIQQTGASYPTALGEYQSNLVVFFPDSAQVWIVDPDPKLHAFANSTPIGTPFAHSHANMGSDIYFLSPAGFRSVSVQANSANLMDMDVGSPIDLIVKPLIKSGIKPRSVYFRGGGQLFCFVGSDIYTYTFSRAAKVSAWAIWTLPVTVDAVAELNGVMYIRSGDVVYALDDEAFTDDGVPIDVDIELPYADCKMIGVFKQFIAADVACTGSPSISYRYNPRSPDLITQPMTFKGDTRSLARMPIEVCATNIAVRMTHSAVESFELAAVSLTFNPMSDFSN